MGNAFFKQMKNNSLPKYNFKEIAEKINWFDEEGEKRIQIIIYLIYYEIKYIAFLLYAAYLLSWRYFK